VAAAGKDALLGTLFSITNRQHFMLVWVFLYSGAGFGGLCRTSLFLERFANYVSA
jgi:hypothetical protein